MKLKIKGAIDKDNNYIFPHNGIKKEKYKCPECNEDIIFKKGEIVIPHFSHKANSNCTYYSSSPSESEIHIYAKNKLAQWLEEKKKLKIIGACFSCNEQFINKKIKHKDGDEVIIEYNSPCRKYIADVAIINNGKVRYVLEVTNTHKTIDEAAEARPEPWFDFNAIDIINDMDFDKNKSKLSCIRNDCNRFCDKCIPEKNNIEECKNIFKNYIKYNVDLGIEWKCILCGGLPYSTGEDILPNYNIIYNYKFKNLNVDIAVFNEEKIKFFILFNENIIDKLQENIKWFYFEPEKFIEQYKELKNDEYFCPRCDKSNFGQYCCYSFCYNEKWVKYDIPKPTNSKEKGLCLICNKNNDFYLLNGTDHPIKVCNDCIYSNCRNKLLKFQKKKKETIHNNYVIYLNVPYNERNNAKKLGAKWDKDKKKWYASIYEEEKFSRWLDNKIQQKNKNGRDSCENCENCVKFNDNHIYSDCCDLCKKDKIALKLEINKYIKRCKKRSY